MKAWCFASGVIEFGQQEPFGAITFASGPAKHLKPFVAVRARHAYDGETLLVPGVPETQGDQEAGVDALRKWCTWLETGKPSRVDIW